MGDPRRGHGEGGAHGHRSGKRGSAAGAPRQHVAATNSELRVQAAPGMQAAWALPPLVPPARRFTGWAGALDGRLKEVFEISFCREFGERCGVQEREVWEGRTSELCCSSNSCLQHTLSCNINTRAKEGVKLPLFAVLDNLESVPYP